MGPNMTSSKRFATPGSILAALIAVVAGALTVLPAHADDSVPSNTVRVGEYFVRYSASAQNLQGPFTPPGINLSVDSVNTPYFAYLRRLSPAWELEFAFGVPPTTHTRGVGPAYLGSVPFNGQEVDTAKWFSPTVLIEYKFRDEHEAFRPYVGAGVNYTHFYERNSTAAGNAANGGPTAVDLSNSLGPAATAGLSYKFTDRINAIASYSFAKVDSDYRSITAGVVRTTSIHFNPRTFVVAVGYSF
jgi:outer membrane protein